MANDRGHRDECRCPACHPRPKTKRAMSAYLREDLMGRMDEECTRQERTRTSCLEEAIEAWLIRQAPAQ